jgi:adenylyltransferase/sulfurtransferase
VTQDERDRYSRQILFAPIGESGQEKISSANVCVVGCGALGSIQAEGLARAGVRSLRLIDRDYVEYSNLQRQWLYSEAEAESQEPKAIAAARRLQQINHLVQTEPVVADLTPSNAEELLADCDIILDGTDNFETRYLINDISVKHGVPWIYGAAIGSYGITMPLWPEFGPCFACVYPERPLGLQPTCDVNGVLASTTTAIAALQMTMALKMIVGWPDFRCEVRSFDVWSGNEQRVFAGEADPDCPVCAQRQFVYLDEQRRTPVSLCGRNAVQLHENARPLNLRELAARLSSFGEIRVNEFALRMDLRDYQLTFFPDGRAIIKGTTDVGVARSLYARFVGA